MEPNKPYCYLYKNQPNYGDLYVSTVVKLPAKKDLGRATQTINGSTTTVTYTLISSGLPEGIREPTDEKIAWDGTERIVEVVVDSGSEAKMVVINSNDAD